MRKLSFPVLTCLSLLMSCGNVTTPGGTAAGAVERTSEPNAIGINLNWGTTEDYSADRLFADAMKQARMWYKVSATSTQASLDSHFWPTEDAGLVVMDLGDNEGVYQCSFTGSATVSPGVYGLGCDGEISDYEYNPSTNKSTFVITNRRHIGAMSLNFTATKRTAASEENTGITDLKIMRPKEPFSTESYTEDTLFTDQILTLVKKFQVIRFMDYTRTNANQQVTWSQRALTTDASYSSSYRQLLDYVWNGINYYSTVGGPYEYAIELCNQSGCDLWINVPLKADDTFVTNLATLIKNNLDSSLNVYVEYSNEVWNTAPGFSQGNQNHELAQAEVSTSSPALDADDETNTWIWARRRVGLRLVEISNLFRAVWLDAAMPAPGKAASEVRVRPVLMGQQGYMVGPQDAALTFVDHNYPQPPNYYFYGIGGSAYYNPSDDAGVDLWSIWWSETMDPETWLNRTCIEEAVTARAYGLKRIAYEGGPSFDSGAANDAVRKKAWGNDRMEQNLVDHFDRAWAASDSDLLVYYASAGNYQWGFTDSIFNLDTPKLRAIDRLNATTKAAVTIGRVPPFTVNGADFERALQYSDYSYGNGTIYVLKGKVSLLYPFRVTEAGDYTATLTFEKSDGAFDILGDGLVLDTGSAFDSVTAKTVTLTGLQPGLHVVMLTLQGTSAQINTVSFAKL